MFQTMISNFALKSKQCKLYVQAAVFSAATAASSAMAMVPADIDFPGIATTILGWVAAAALAAVTLFGVVQGLKIGIRTFRSIANTATA
ncbi:MAG: hypothetical protein D3906_02500 [Candidatus Electrothrix sp. AUS1_2]|nr:hypothetical protein [Candidatus Electrothrix sp. AUS1_2]